MELKMTIDEAISHLGVYSSTMGSGQTTQAQHEDAKRVAIDTMRKYQKIEEIRHRVKYTDLEPAKAYELINEVVEDGGSEEEDKQE